VTRFDQTRFDAATFEPIAVATRSGFDESLHFGAGVVIDDAGAVESEIGDGALAVYPRSCLKPMQADAMVAAGLALPLEQLALACASHSGELQHLNTVRATLNTAGFDEAALRNNPDRPYGGAARLAAFEAGVAPSSLQQNCSGKHAAMLATCQVNGWSVDDYLDVEHPLQQAISARIELLAAEPVRHIGTDGCGAPTHVISVRGLANAFARLAQGSAVADAMRAHPELIGGSGRDVTAWMRAVPGLIAKEGAAGVMAAALPDGRAVAYKIADGSEAARQAVMPEAMRLLGVDRHLIEEVVETAASDSAVTVLGGGAPVGRLVGLEWPGRG